MSLHLTVTAQKRDITFNHKQIVRFPLHGYFYLDFKLDTNCNKNFGQLAILWPHSTLQAVCVPRSAIRYSGSILRAGSSASFSGLKLGLSNRCSAKRLQAWRRSPQGHSKMWSGTGGSHWRGASYNDSVNKDDETSQSVSHPL